MKFTARVFARNEKGELMKFDAAEVESFTEAINMVRTELKAPRALCLVASVSKPELIAK